MSSSVGPLVHCKSNHYHGKSYFSNPYESLHVEITVIVLRGVVCLFSWLGAVKSAILTLFKTVIHRLYTSY